jgi:hypothetical protein
MNKTGLVSLSVGLTLELCLSVTVLCCTAGFVTGMKIKQRIDLKFLVKLKKFSQE